MHWIRNKGIGRRYTRVQIVSDSQYVVNSQRSAPFWNKAKWRTLAGRPIESPDLWDEFLSVRSKAGVRVDIIKVLNKSAALLKFVDMLAKTAAKSHPRKDYGLVVGKIGRAKIKGTPTLYPAANQSDSGSNRKVKNPALLRRVGNEAAPSHRFLPAPADTRVCSGYWPHRRLRGLFVSYIRLQCDQLPWHESRRPAGLEY